MIERSKAEPVPVSRNVFEQDWARRSDRHHDPTRTEQQVPIPRPAISSSPCMPRLFGSPTLSPRHACSCLRAWVPGRSIKPGTWRLIERDEWDQGSRLGPERPWPWNSCPSFSFRRWESWWSPARKAIGTDHPRCPPTFSTWMSDDRIASPVFKRTPPSAEAGGDCPSWAPAGPGPLATRLEGFNGQ